MNEATTNMHMDNHGGGRGIFQSFDSCSDLCLSCLQGISWKEVRATYGEMILSGYNFSFRSSFSRCIIFRTRHESCFFPPESGVQMRWSSKRCFSVEYTLLDSLLLMLDSLLPWFSLSFSDAVFDLLLFSLDRFSFFDSWTISSLEEQKGSIGKGSSEKNGHRGAGSEVPSKTSLFISLTRGLKREREVENGHLGDLIILFPLSRYKSSSSSCFVAVDAQAILFNASLAFCFQYFSFPYKESVAMDEVSLQV